MIYFIIERSVYQPLLQHIPVLPPFRAEPLIGAFGQDDPAREGLDGGGDGVAGGALAVGGGYDGAAAIHRAEGDGFGPAVEKIGLTYTLSVLILIMLHEHSFCCAAD